MIDEVDISICIPAFKSVPLLRRLLESVKNQTFQRYEIILTDDTPDNSVQDLLKEFHFKQPLKYLKNTPSLGSPENWNEAIRQSRGTWIKLMHTDDWFSSSNALQVFYDYTLKHPDASFFFSAYNNIDDNKGKVETVKCNAFDLFFLKLTPLHLFNQNYVGQPSCTMIKRDIGLTYDNQFIFIVDFEFYIRCFRKLKHYVYIDNPLINIGIHKDQVTKFTFLVPEVQIPENIIVLQKFGIGILKNPIVYDHYWRLFRNLKIRNKEDIKKYYSGPVPAPLRKMLQTETKISLSLLTKGYVSKALMLKNYVANLLHF